MINEALKKILLNAETTILDTLKAIDETATEIALIVDSQSKLLGTATDGDIRRGLIKGYSLETPISKVMNTQPVTASHSQTHDELMFIMLNRSIKQLPILDNLGRPIKLIQLKDLIKKPNKPNVAVIMAGGKGTRLGKLTQDLPKPLLPYGNKPIIAHIAQQLQMHGFSNLYISVNYKAQLIIDYFAQNPITNLKISFLMEEKALGTAGSLSLLPKIALSHPILVTNGDLIAQVNYENLLDFHNQKQGAITLCTKQFTFQIPYGVLNTQGSKLLSIDEKPVHSVFVNAGIYVIEPELIAAMPPNSPLDMPELINSASAQAKGVACYPLSESWLDIGTPAEYAKINHAESL
jgi:dTDP-glucose pyrophosphorylase